MPASSCPSPREAGTTVWTWWSCTRPHPTRKAQQGFAAYLEHCCFTTVELEHCCCEPPAGASHELLAGQALGEVLESCHAEGGEALLLPLPEHREAARWMQVFSAEVRAPSWTLGASIHHVRLLQSGCCSGQALLAACGCSESGGLGHPSWSAQLVQSTSSKAPLPSNSALACVLLPPPTTRCRACACGRLSQPRVQAHQEPRHLNCPSAFGEPACFASFKCVRPLDGRIPPVPSRAIPPVRVTSPHICTRTLHLSCPLVLLTFGLPFTA